MLAHTSKIFFWFGERYVYTLLVQSILVIIILLYIIYLCVKYRDKPQNNASESSSPDDNNTNIISCKESTKIFFCDLFSCTKTYNPHLIWRWDKSIEYYKFYFVIIAILTGLLFAFGVENKLYAEVLGYMNLFFEMLCSLPQIVELCLTKNQRNISKLMIFFWFCGNVVKIYYNYYNEAPLQLIPGGYIQVFFNIILIGQLIYYYRKNTQDENAKKDPKEKTSDEHNDDNSESHISIVRKTDVSDNDESESNHLLVDDKNKNIGEVKEDKEVKLKKERKNDIGEESEDNEEENDNELIMVNEGNDGNEEEQRRQELIIDLEDNKN